ncbi:MAG: hypothetical protein ABIG34_00105 [Candidatus Peregrinibacteria bacterium]
MDSSWVVPVAYVFVSLEGDKTMLVRSAAVADGVVFRGEHPGLVLVVKNAGKARLGFEFGLGVPILGFSTLKKELDAELSVPIPTPEEVQANGFTSKEVEAFIAQYLQFQEVYRRMQELLQNPPANAAAIVELLHDPAFEDIFIIREEDAQNDE